MQYPVIAQPQYAFAPTMMAEGGLVPAARAVQSKGRNGDSMLVHMTPGEVGGLQALAMQHGGSLSINPQTGLPEAGFLKNILPAVLGIALTPFMGPLAAGLTVGGVETVRTGDIGKGFLAGLGAYGGAQIGGALGGASAASAAPTVASATPTAAGAGLEFARTPAEIAAATGGTAPTALAPSSLGTTVNPVTFGDTGAAIYGGTASPAMQAANLAVDPMAVAGDSSRIVTSGGQAVAGARPTYGQMGQGFKDLFTQEGAFDRFIGQAGTQADEKRGVEAVKATGLGGGYGAAKTAAMAGAPMIMDALTPKPYEPPAQEKDESNYEGPYTPSQRRVSYPTDDERRRRTSEFTYFNPSNPVPFAEGGESKASPDVVVSPNEARVYQDILNVQRLAGLPALDPSRFAVMPGRSYEQFVYNPIEAGPSSGGMGPERNYGFEAFMGKEEVEKALAPKLAPKKESSRFSVLDGRFPQSGVLRRFSTSGDSFAKGGVPMLEDGGFVLTKKAVDGLGKGSNKKGQKAASRGLGAIPIKGPGTGTSDSIKTSIEGKRPALVSNGEAYVPKKQVAKRGGAKAFYALMDKAEKQAKKAKRA